MPTPVAAARQCLAPAAITALDAAVASARRRAHAQTTSLHLVSSLLAPAAPPLLRDALAHARSAAYSPRLQLKALDLCFAVSLDRLQSSSASSSSAKGGGGDEDPPVSNSLMAAIKRSQANQRRNPDAFHFYQTYHHPQSPTSTVRVDLSHLLLAILDDPLVSRVFADAGFRGADIKLAILRPVPLIGRLPARARPPPLFLCSFGDILSRGRNPMLVGVGAASAAAEFAAKASSPYRILHLGPNSINQQADDLHAAVATSSTSPPSRGAGGGLIVSIGDLKDLVPNDDDQPEEDKKKKRVVSEVTRLLETHRSSIWVMGWSATYETYLAFLSKFPLVNKDWDLQLLPVTALRSSSDAAAGAMPPATTLTPPLPAPATLTPTTSNSSNCDNRKDIVTSSSAGTVATDLALGTPREYSSRGSSSASCKHVGDSERPVNPKHSKVDDLNLKPTQPFVQPYSCSRSLSNPGQISPGALHPAASGGNSAFGQWQRPSPMAAQSSDMSNYKLLVERLFKSVGRQEEALSAICESIVRCRSMERRRGSNKRNDIWLSFHGPDSIAKRQVAAALAELMHGSSDNLICLDLSHQDWGDSNFRGKTGTDCIVEELRKKRRSVIFLDNIDKADFLVQDNLYRAIEIGKFDWQGRLVDLNDSIVVLSTRMTRECKNASLGMKEEGHAFSEENIMAARGHQLKILVEPGAGNITGGPGGKAVVSTGSSATSVHASLSSGSVSKRKLSISDGQEKMQESPSSSKRLHRTSSVPFDLNLPIDEDEARDADDDSSSSSGNADGSIENLLRSVDGSVSFKPFDFGKLCEDMLQEFSNTVSNILGSGCRLEIDVGAMEQILAEAWASDSEKMHVRTWLEQVFTSSLEQVRHRFKNVSNFTVRLVTCEDTLLKDEGVGALLPSRIILDW